MFRYADPAACPRCRASLAASPTSCPSCHAALDGTSAYDVFLALQQVDRLVGRLTDTVTPPSRTPPSRPDPLLAPPVLAPRTLADPVPMSPGSAATTRVPAQRAVLSGLTVPKILLGLGALCLVVAALVFLAVAWAALGVAGRTVVLVVLTGIAGGLASWSATRGLRAGSESLTAVAFGLLVLDLTGARTSGWFGDLGWTGFTILTGTVIAGLGTASALVVRRTPAPRLITAEVVTVLGLLATAAATTDLDWATPQRWTTAVTVVATALSLGFRRLGLAVPTWSLAALGGLTWLALAFIGVGRVAAHPSWTELVGGGDVWPLTAAALLAAAPAVVRSCPLVVRVGAAGASVLLVTIAVAAPTLDEGVEWATLTSIAVVAVHAALARALARPWKWVTTTPSLLSASFAGLTALGAAGAAAFALLDHGLWTATASTRPDVAGPGHVWSALLPVATAGCGLALIALVGVASPAHTRLASRISAAGLALALTLGPTLLEAPLAASVAALVLATAACLTWAIRRDDLVPWCCAAPAGALALGAALADDGLTIAVLTLATVVLGAAELRRTPPWLAVAATWALPLTLAATVWSVAAAADLHGGWRAAPVIAALGLLALARPGIGHEASGGAAALVAITVSAGLEPADHRLVAAQLAAIASVATLVGVLRRPAASIAGLAGFAVAALVAWPSAVTGAAVLALMLAASATHEVRRVAPAAALAAITTPVALGGLLWEVSDLVGLKGGGLGVATSVALGVLAVARPLVAREATAAVVATLAALTATALSTEGQTWAAVYLTLGGAILTSASLVHADRRRLAWAGLTLFTVAQWLRLEELGVGTVEAYTLPLASVLLVVGVLALRRGTRSSLQTLAAGLSLALVPSLLQSLVEPVGLRAVLLGVGCLACIAVGVNRRWAAPLLAGSGTLAVLVLRQATIAQDLPQWALIGLAGVTLTFVGLTWEARLANVRAAADYVRDLR